MDPKRRESMTIIYIGKHLKMYQVADHRHDYCELVYCTGGSGTFRSSGGHEVAYGEGELVLIPERMLHCNLSEKGFSNLYVALRGIAYNPGRMVKISDSENRDIHHTLLQIFYYFNCAVPNRAGIMTSLTQLLENYLVSFAKIRRNSPYVEQICTEITNNFSDSSFTVRQALAALPLNAEYLRKLFLREKGVSPARYLNDMRLEHARQMLMRKDAYGLQIGEIAQACGFADPLYFSRAFRHRSGMSPGKYAETHRAGDPA